MDQNQSNNSNSTNSNYWTNERHGNFLNSLENSFVRNMLEDRRRLDRVLPDSSESTQDIGSQSGNDRRRRHQNSSGGRYDDKAARRNPSKSFPSSQDQVVPQLKDEGEDKDVENNVVASHQMRQNRR